MAIRSNYAMLFALVAVCVCVLALPMISSHIIEREIKAWAKQASQTDLSIRQLHHQSGYLSSTGSFDLQLRSTCTQSSDQALISLKLAYTVHHLPSLKGPLQFDWTATPDESVGSVLKNALGGNGALSGQGAITYGGLFRTDMTLPEISLAEHGHSIKVTPSTGRLGIDKQTLKFGWSVDRAVFRGNSSALEIRNIGIDMDLKDSSLGTGSGTLTIDSVSNQALSLTGLRISTQTQEMGDRINSTISETLQSASFGGNMLKNLASEITVKGLHTKSWQTLTGVLRESCGFQSLTPEESRQARAAVKTILTSGLSLGIPVLKGSSPDAEITGDLMLQLMPAKNDQVTLAKQLESSGHISIKGTLLNPQQKQLALDSGFAREEGGALKATFTYSGGVVKVSDKPFDASDFQSALAVADRVIAEFLNVSVSPAQGKVKSATPEIIESPGDKDIEPPAAEIRETKP